MTPKMKKYEPQYLHYRNVTYQGSSKSDEVWYSKNILKINLGT